MFYKTVAFLYLVIGVVQFSFSQNSLYKTIPTPDPVYQISNFSNTVVYSIGNETYFCNYGQDTPQLYYGYAANDISFVFPVGHDTLSVISWGGTLTLFYGNADSVFNSDYSYPTNFPVRSIGVNGDLFYNQSGDTVYALNSYNAENDQWNILRMSGGNSLTIGSNFFDPELVNYSDLDYMQAGANRYIAIVKPNDLMLYNLATGEYISTGIANISSFQYFALGGNAFYSIGNSIYRIDSISGNSVNSTLAYVIPESQMINEISLSDNGTVWVAANDGVYSTHSSGVGMEELEILSTIYPNPVLQNLFIKSSDRINQIEIIDLFGRTILVLTEINTFETSLNLSNYSNGNYVVKVSTASKTEFHSLIKN
jgi:hypothetical protein